MKVFIKNKYFTFGGSSYVTDDAGRQIFKVKGKVFSFRRKKFIYDMDGNLLYRVQNRFFNFFVHHAYVFDANGEKLCTVKDRFFNIHKEYFILGTQDHYKIDGRFASLDSRITRNGEIIAFIHRDFNILRDSFQLEAKPEDIPFLTALLIAVDNICDNKQQ